MRPTAHRGGDGGGDGGTFSVFEFNVFSSSPFLFRLRLSKKYHIPIVTNVSGMEVQKKKIKLSEEYCSRLKLTSEVLDLSSFEKLMIPASKKV